MINKARLGGIGGLGAGLPAKSFGPTRRPVGPAKPSYPLGGGVKRPLKQKPIGRPMRPGGMSPALKAYKRFI